MVRSRLWCAVTYFFATFLVFGMVVPASADYGAEENGDALGAWARELGHVPSMAGDSESADGGEGSDGVKGSESVYIASRELGVDSKYTCEDLPEGEDPYWAVGCSLNNYRCQIADVLDTEGAGYLATEQVRIDNRSGKFSEELLDFDCRRRGGAPAEGAGSKPVEITLTREDFESMPVEPMVASAGPPDGWLPVNMVNVLYAEGEAQMMDMELLDTPVQVRATPVLYDWDLGDGNTISTTNAGKPFPSEEVSATYRYEGWYDVTLTTTFSGEYSVDGGPWQTIDGTIEVASEPIGIFSKSLESRLVNPDVPVDEDEDPWIPERTAETEGRKDPDASHREL